MNRFRQHLDDNAIHYHLFLCYRAFIQFIAYIFMYLHIVAAFSLV